MGDIIKKEKEFVKTLIYPSGTKRNEKQKGIIFRYWHNQNLMQKYLLYKWAKKEERSEYFHYWGNPNNVLRNNRQK